MAPNHEVLDTAAETGPLLNIGEHRVRLTEQEAQHNLHTVLQLCAAGEVRCSDKTSRPTAATIRTVVSHLAHGDFYLLDPIASFAWPLLVQAGGLAKVDTLFSIMQRGNMSPTVARSETALWRLYLADAQYGSVGYDGFCRWEILEGPSATRKPRY